METDNYWIIGILYFLLLIAFFVWAFSGNVNTASVFDGRWTTKVIEKAIHDSLFFDTKVSLAPSA